MKKIVGMLIILTALLNTSFAESKIALKYNIIPSKDSVINSIIDSNAQTKLNFMLYTNEKIYLNSNPIFLTDNTFYIDISNLRGYQEFKFTNDFNEEVTFSYYISDKKGLVPNYTIENYPVYIKTLNNTKIIYTTKDFRMLNYITSLILNMPCKLKSNLREITLYPSNHFSNVAGITKYNKISLYNISSYTNSEIKRIIFHEIAHTWAHNLRENKIIDYSYTKFGNAVKQDNNFVTKYSSNSLSEDFADSIAYYLMNPTAFKHKFPARTDYIKSII